ncbi:MAG: hypothetical protein HUU21_12670 [Polyangiaceae bacterium]|nr:hypothetical protein [Polyangiaceae bacterium]
MLGQNARKTIDHRPARRIPPGSRRTASGIRSESAPRRSDRDWGDGQDDDDDEPDSVLGVQVSIVEAMRSFMASGIAGHGGGGHSRTSDIQACALSAPRESDTDETGGGSAAGGGGGRST